ncbi:YrdB family protein [Nocardioides sp. YIM 152315]|uniref:YrdB family protein n=1 Tax=Nocardioides sp. YIM 152315 TaxID=3031760 RepID=UPI0023D9EB10|nr:YrdB family protein [Nocardioides sp. YIM 152315]MDF1606380.1 YrdB family protein [Nocardioides sp. YIM 152315]
MTVAFGWLVLLLVFVDEVLAMAAFGVWGWQQDARWLLVWLLPVVACAAWFLFASPKAQYGGPLRRPLVKVAVFGLASLALWDAGHPGWAAALLAFSVVVNALAQIPAIARLPDQMRTASETVD